MISRIVRQTGGIWAWIRGNAIVVTFLAGEGLIFGSWMITQELTDRQHTIDLQYARDSIINLKADVARIDDRGSRELPEVKARLQQHENEFAADRKQIDDLIASGSPTIRARLDSLKEQQERNVRELEAVRNQLTDHMRFDRQTRNGDIQMPPRRDPRNNP